MWGRRGYKRNNRACKQDYLRHAGFRTISGGNWLGRTCVISFRTQLLLLGYHLVVSAALLDLTKRILNHFKIFISHQSYLENFSATDSASTLNMGYLTYLCR
jgi:hypothetical protein